jgi:hypothetical protein
MKTIAISLASVLFAASICAAAQGLTIVSKETRDDGTTETTTSYISEDHVRWSSGDAEVIIDGKAGSMTTLDSKKKQYYVTTQKDIEAMAAMMKEKMNSPEMKRAQEAMKNLPPEQREKMQSMMGSMFTVNVEKAGGSRTIAGYRCDNWVVSIGKMSRTEECVTNDLKFPPQAWEMYRKLADSMKSMMASMRPMGANIDSMQEQFKKMKGFPLASKTTTSVMGRTTVTTNEVTDVKNGAIPATAFDVPAGYTRVENPMTKAMARAR